MRKDKAYCYRKFGKISVKINYHGSISIIGPSYRISGVIYANIIKAFKKGKINHTTNMPVQVIGLDSPLKAQKPITWIYQKIRDGKFDHLMKA